MTEFNFAQLLKDAGSFEPVPKGQYDAVIDSAEAKQSSNGKLMYATKLKIVGGPQNGRVVFNNITLTTDNPNALRMFFMNMKAFGLTEEFFAAGPQPTDVATALLGRSAKITIDHRMYQGSMRENVTGIAPGGVGVGGIAGVGAAPSIPGIPAAPAIAPPAPPVAAPVAPPAPPVAPPAAPAPVVAPPAPEPVAPVAAPAPEAAAPAAFPPGMDADSYAAFVAFQASQAAAAAPPAPPVVEAPAPAAEIPASIPAPVIPAAPAVTEGGIPAPPKSPF